MLYAKARAWGDGFTVDSVRVDADIREAVRFVRRERRAVKSLLRKVKPQDFPHILERLPKEDRLQLALILPDEVLEGFIAKLPPEVVREVVAGMEKGRLVKIASNLPADELSDLVGKLPSHVKKVLLDELPHHKLSEVEPLLAYPPNTAGGLMTNRIPVFFEEAESGRVIEEFTARSKLNGYDTSHYIYAVDRDGRLVGRVSVNDVLVAPKGKRLKDLGCVVPVVVNAYVDQEEVARIMARYDLLELPVVDGKGVLLGVVTIDDVIDVVVDESAEDLEKFGGLARRVTAPYLTARVAELVKKRAVWLAALCIFQSVTIGIVSRFESILAGVVALAFFMPLLCDVGGNTGSQSSSFVIRALATGDVTIYDALKVLVKESVTSLALGALLSPIIFSLGFLATGALRIAALLSITVVVIVYVASIIGGLLPLLAVKVRVDPASISAPLITTIADIVGLTLYFTMAMLFLSL